MVQAPSFFGREVQRGSRSTILSSLGWALAICVSGTATFQTVGIPQPVVLVAACLSALVLFIYLGMYLYFAKHDRDALRSERFIIQRYVIDARLMGDRRSGRAIDEDFNEIELDSDPALPATEEQQ